LGSRSTGIATSKQAFDRCRENMLRCQSTCSIQSWSLLAFDKIFSSRNCARTRF